MNNKFFSFYCFVNEHEVFKSELVDQETRNNLCVQILSSFSKIFKEFISLLQSQASELNSSVDEFVLIFTSVEIN